MVSIDVNYVFSNRNQFVFKQSLYSAQIPKEEFHMGRTILSVPRYPPSFNSLNRSTGDETSMMAQHTTKRLMDVRVAYK